MSSVIRFVLLVSAFSMAACVTQTAPAPIDYPQYQKEREKKVMAMVGLLQEIKARVFEKEAAFDPCFLNEVEKLKDPVSRASVLLQGPKDGKLIITDISGPQDLKSPGEFNACLRRVINRLTIQSEYRPVKNITFVVQPSWGNGSPTTVKPSNVVNPAREVCIMVNRNFYTIKAGDWDVLKQGHHYITEKADKLGSRQVFLCTHQDIPSAMKLDPESIARDFPNEDIKGSIVFDGFHD
jgi:hypothetical protein